MTMILLGVSYLGLALSGESPVVYCSAAFEQCPAETSDSCAAREGRDCCSRGENQGSRPDCCVTVSEKGNGWVLPSSVKVPDLTVSELLPLTVPSPEKPALSQDSPTSANAPDPPGPAGRSLLIQVSRQLV